METGDISRDQAADALATVERCRELIQAEWAKGRGKRYGLFTFSMLTPLVVYPAKDLIRSRARRWALSAGWQAASYGVGRAMVAEPIISRMPSLRPEALKRWGGYSMAVMAGSAVAELLVVQLLRRSRLRRPNVVAGFVVAGLRSGVRLFLLKRVMFPPSRPEEVAAADVRIHRALVLPDTLRVAALLGDGEIVDLQYIRDTFGLDRLELAEDLRPLFDDKLAVSTTGRDRVMVLLTPEGREAFAQHVQALHQRTERS